MPTAPLETSTRYGTLIRPNSSGAKSSRHDCGRDCTTAVQLKQGSSSDGKSLITISTTRSGPGEADSRPRAHSVAVGCLDNSIDITAGFRDCFARYQYV